MLPQVGVGIGTPSPRNDRVASNTIAVGISSVAYTMIAATRFGITSMTMILKSLAPRDLAASTYSFSLMDSTWPRTMRPTLAQVKKAMTKMLIRTLGLNTETSE